MENKHSNNRLETMRNNKVPGSIFEDYRKMEIFSNYLMKENQFKKDYLVRDLKTSQKFPLSSKN